MISEELGYEFDDKVVDVVVIGGGMSGLVAARNLLELGRDTFPGIRDVVLLEASPRLGGRTLTTEFNVSSKEGLEPVRCDLGAEWFDPKRHNAVYEEVDRYGAKFVFPDYRNMTNFGRGRDSLVFDGKIPVPMNEESEFKRVMSLVNEDVDSMRNADDSASKFDGYDRPLADYVDTSLRATGCTKGFLMSQGFAHSGADSQIVSAATLLRDVSAFGLAENAFLSELARIDCGAGGLAERIAIDAAENVGVMIYTNTPVLSISAAVKPQPPPKSFAEDDNAGVDDDGSLGGGGSSSNIDLSQFGSTNVDSISHVKIPDGRIIVRTINGRSIVARGVIVAVPLNCLPSISFTPKLPGELGRAAERCNVGACMKGFVHARGVSKHVDQVQCWPGCTESYVIHRYEQRPQEEPIDEETTIEEETIEKNTENKTADSKNERNYNSSDSDNGFKGVGDNKEDDNNDDDNDHDDDLDYEYSYDEQRSKSRPASSSAQEGRGGRSRPTSRNDMKGRKKKNRAAVLGIFGLYEDLLGSKRQLEDKLRMHHPIIELLPFDDNQTSNKLRTHNDHHTNNTDTPHSKQADQNDVEKYLVRHDWVADPWIRGTWLALRAGTAALHTTARKAAKCPWGWAKELRDKSTRVGKNALGIIPLGLGNRPGGGVRVASGMNTARATSSSRMISGAGSGNSTTRRSPGVSRKPSSSTTVDNGRMMSAELSNKELTEGNRRPDYPTISTRKATNSAVAGGDSDNDHHSNQQDQGRNYIMLPRHKKGEPQPLNLNEQELPLPQMNRNGVQPIIDEGLAFFDRLNMGSATTSSSIGSAVTIGSAMSSVTVVDAVGEDNYASLIIAGGDLSDKWGGWVEGAMLSGREAAEMMINHLSPPPPPRGFQRMTWPGK